MDLRKASLVLPELPSELSGLSPNATIRLSGWPIQLGGRLVCGKEGLVLCPLQAGLRPCHSSSQPLAPRAAWAV